MFAKRNFATIAFVMAIQCSFAITDNAPKQAVTDDMNARQVQLAALKESHHIMVPGLPVDSLDQDSVRATIEMFYIDQFRNFQDPKVPYFLLMSKDGKLAMGVGGAVKVHGWSDFSGAVGGNEFHPYDIPVPADPSMRKGIGASASGTALFMKIVARDLPVGDLIANIEGKFDGYKGVGFRIKKAYVTLNDWTVGYAPSTFSDPASQVPTVDGAGPNSYVSHKTVLVRYIHKFKQGWRVAGSVEFPGNDMFTDTDFAKPLTSYVPDVSAFVQYEWNKGDGHIRLSGITRVMPYRDLVANRNHSVFGWGVHLSAVVPVTYGLTLYGNVNTGKGYSSYLGDLSEDKLDLIADAHNDAQMYAPMIWGACVGAQYNFLSNVYACVGISECRMMPKDAGLAPTDMFKYGIYGVANIFWDITPRISVGAEYLHGVRKNFGGEHAAANRIDAFFQFSF